MKQPIMSTFLAFVFLTMLCGACTPASLTVSPTIPASQTAPTITVIPATPTDVEEIPITLFINDARLPLEMPPYVEDGIIYLPGQEVFDALGYHTYIVMNAANPYIGGLKYTADETLTKFHIEFGSKDGVIDPGLATERFISFNAPAKYEDGKVMLPLEFIAANPGIMASYDQTSRRIDIDSGQSLTNFSLQEGVAFDAVIFKNLTSDQLVDNRIGALASGLSMDNFTWELDGNSDHLSVSEQVNCGIKRWSLTINNQDWEPENWNVSEFEIDPRYRLFYEQLTQQGLILTYNLIFKDKDFLKAGGVLGYPRFKDEAEIQRYLDYVRTTVRYFKGVVAYYEIWNEQNIQGTGQYIEPDDYINLVKRVVPIIREEDPAAKISVGQTTQFDDPASRAYTYRIIESDLMPIVDAIALHTFFWDSPEHESEYYYDYPNLLQDVKETAWAHGFKGEFIGSEGNYSPNIPEDMNGRVPIYSNLQAGIYVARGNVTNLGLGFSGGNYGIGSGHGIAYTMICNLATIMAGAQPQEVEVEVQSNAEKIRHYGFSLPNGDSLISVWTDGVAKEFDPGEKADLRIAGFQNYTVTAIDILKSMEQKIVSTTEQDTLIIENLLIKDYPIILRLSPRN